jgi:molecular chaperone GrpE
MAEEARKIDIETEATAASESDSGTADSFAPEAEPAAAEAASEATGEQPDEATQWKEKALRAMAELENNRRRSEKEIQDAKKYGVTGFAREMLTVQDNVERALAACKSDKADVKMIQAGVEMLAQQFEQSMERFQIKKFESVGQPLNPDRHQVMQEEESDQPAGTVIKELQPGYLIGERLLRPALVVTAKEQQHSTESE